MIALDLKTCAEAPGSLIADNSSGVGRLHLPELPCQVLAFVCCLHVDARLNSLSENFVLIPLCACLENN